MKLPEGNLVKTIWIDGCKIEFCDDYVARTPEDIAKVKREIYKTAWRIVLRLREEGVYI